MDSYSATGQFSFQHPDDAISTLMRSLDPKAFTASHFESLLYSRWRISPTNLPSRLQSITHDHSFASAKRINSTTDSEGHYSSGSHASAVKSCDLSVRKTSISEPCGDVYCLRENNPLIKNTDSNDEFLPLDALLDKPDDFSTAGQYPETDIFEGVSSLTHNDFDNLQWCDHSVNNSPVLQSIQADETGTDQCPENNMANQNRTQIKTLFTTKKEYKKKRKSRTKNSIMLTKMHLSTEAPKKHRPSILWFLIEKLDNASIAGLSWVDRKLGIYYRARHANKPLAKLWGKETENPGMDYAKLSRAIANYYNSENVNDNAITRLTCHHDNNPNAILNVSYFQINWKHEKVNCYNRSVLKDHRYNPLFDSLFSATPNHQLLFKSQSVPDQSKQ